MHCRAYCSQLEQDSNGIELVEVLDQLSRDDSHAWLGTTSVSNFPKYFEPRISLFLNLTFLKEKGVSSLFRRGLFGNKIFSRGLNPEWNVLKLSTFLARLPTGREKFAFLKTFCIFKFFDFFLNHYFQKFSEFWHFSDRQKLILIPHEFLFFPNHVHIVSEPCDKADTDGRYAKKFGALLEKP